MMKINNNIKNTSNKGFNLKEIIGIMIVTSIISIFITGTVFNNHYSTSDNISYFKLLKEPKVKEFLDVYSKVSNGYYESIDKNGALDAAIAGMMNYLGDDYTTLMNENDAENLMNGLSGTYQGIGIGISTQIPGLILKVYDNTPAKKAGIQENDVIIKINETDINTDNHGMITNIIKNSLENINLTIKRNNDILTFHLKAEEIVKPAINYEMIVKENKNIGYLQIKSFAQNISQQVNKALQELETDNMQSLIIDLRNNGGGYLKAATETANLFLEKDKIIYSLENKNGYEQVKDGTDTHKNYPIIILINSGTASASEILTAALVDSYGAKTVGTASFGKGKVQNAMPLEDGSIVKYTTSKWLRPNGECIDGEGIFPNYGVELEIRKNEEGQIIEVKDNQLLKAIDILLEN